MATGYENSQYEIPQSRGMPPVVRALFGICILLIFVMGAIAVRFSGEFHVWPAISSMRAPLAGHF